VLLDERGDMGGGGEDAGGRVDCGLVVVAIGGRGSAAQGMERSVAGRTVGYGDELGLGLEGFDDLLVAGISGASGSKTASSRRHTANLRQHSGRLGSIALETGVSALYTNAWPTHHSSNESPK